MESNSPQQIVQEILLKLNTQVTGPSAVSHFTKIQKKASETNKTLNTLYKDMQKSAKRAQKQIGNAFESANKSIENQTQLVKANQRQLEKANRSAARAMGRSAASGGGGGGGGGIGVGSIGSIVGVGLLISKINSMINAKMDLAITGGPALSKRLAGESTSGLSLVSQFLKQSPNAMFGGGDLGGLLQTQKAMGAIGPDLANQLILEVTKSLSPSALQSFLKTSGSGDIKGALSGAANQENIMAVTSALNALTVATMDRAALDPQLQAMLKLTEQLTKLDLTVQNLLTNYTDKLMPLIEGVAKGLGWVSENPNTAVGIGAAGGAALLAPKAIGVAAPALPLAGAVGVLGYGLASLGDSIMSIVDGAPVSPWNMPGRFEGLGNEPYAAMMQRNQDFLLQKMKDRTAAKHANFVGPPSELAGAMAKTTESIKAFGDAIDPNVKRLQGMAASMQGLTKTGELADSEIALKKQAFDLASMSPFGGQGAIPELQELIHSFDIGIQRQIDILNNIDRSSQDGLIAYNKQLATVNAMRIEQKQLRQQEIEAYLNNEIAQVLKTGIGSFEKILITQDQNLARGLTNGMIRSDLAPVTGSIGESFNRSPVSPTQLLGGRNPFVSVDRAFKSTPRIRAKSVGGSGVSELMQLGEIAKVAAEKIGQTLQRLDADGGEPKSVNSRRATSL